MANPSLPVKWREAIRDSGLPKTTKLVAYTLSTHLNSAGTAYPSIVTLARGSSLGRRDQKDNTAVKTAIARLEADGFLDVDRKRGQRGWFYTALIPRADVGLESPAQTWDAPAGIPRADGDESPAESSGIPRVGVGEVEEIEIPEVVTAPEVIAREKVKTNEALRKWLINSGSILAEDRRGFVKEVGAAWGISADVAGALRQIVLDGLEGLAA